MTSQGYYTPSLSPNSGSAYYPYAYASSASPYMATPTASPDLNAYAASLGYAAPSYSGYAPQAYPAPAVSQYPAALLRVSSPNSNCHPCRKEKKRVHENIFTHTKTHTLCIHTGCSRLRGLWCTFTAHPPEHG
jgi:hypothetical protein